MVEHQLISVCCECVLYWYWEWCCVVLSLGLDCPCQLELDIQCWRDIVDEVIPIMHIFVCLDIIGEKIPFLEIVVPRILYRVGG